MPTSIQVEIEHRRYVEIVPARRDARGRLYITTMEPGQHRALIKLFVERRGRRTPLQTIDIRDLPADPQRRLPMDLTSRILPGGRMRVRLYVEGKLFIERMVPVGHLLGPSRSLLAALALLALLALGSVFWMLRTTFGPVDEPPAEVAVEQEEPGEPVTPEPEVDAAEPDRPDEPVDPDDISDPEPEAVAEIDPEEEPEVAAELDPEIDPDDEPAIAPEVHTVRFSPESANLRAAERVKLVSVAERLSQHDLTVRLDGHTAIAGSTEGRRALSRRRAETVRDFLLSEGIDAERFVEIRALGASKPLTRDPDEQQLNRRVEIVEIEE